MSTNDPIIFVTYHMGLAPGTRQQLKQTTNSFAVPDAAETWINLLFQSARYFHPNCRCIVLSDETTPLQVPKGVEIIRGESTAEDPLWSRLNAEYRFLQSLKSTKPNAPIAFLDSDIIVNGELETLFKDGLIGSWDVGLTYRVFDDMPINGGVILVRGGCYRAAERFFEALLDTYVQRHREEKWWGEQLALVDLVGEAAVQQAAQIVWRNSFNIGLLPGQLFNHTPASAANLLHIASSVKILHFKGKRKTFMADYWRWRRFKGSVLNARVSHGQRILLALSAVVSCVRILFYAHFWG